MGKIKYMTQKQAKEAIIDIGQRMYARNFVAANDGNISVRIGKNEIIITPSGVSKGFMKKKMLLRVDLDGNVLEGELKPSSELQMHLRAYKENPDILSVCHAHPPIATSFAVAGIPLDKPILAEALITLGEVPVVPYAAPGSDKLAQTLAPYFNTHSGVLLANHGALTWGNDAYKAYYRLESMEYYANILMITDKISDRQNTLDSEQTAALRAMRGKFGMDK